MDFFSIAVIFLDLLFVLKTNHTETFGEEGEKYIAEAFFFLPKEKKKVFVVRYTF